MDKNYTLEETFKMLGLPEKNAPLCRNIAKNILPSTTGEPDWQYLRVDVKERESGCPELVISIPFGIERL